MTLAQMRLFRFVEHYIRINGYSPNYEEMMKAARLKSKSGVHRILTALVEQRRILRLPHRARSISLVRKCPHCGKPVEA